MKKFISLFTIMSVLLSFCCVIPSYADEPDVTISTAQELSDFRNDVNNGNTYEGKTVVLTQDIDLSSVCGSSIGDLTVEISWTPIGIYKSGDFDNPSRYFSGTFDGNGYEIKNLYINCTRGGLERDRQGLFGTIDNGIVKNLTVSGSITGGNFVGGIAGLSTGIITNCVNKADISTTGFCMGGITGCNSIGIIQSCKNMGSISQGGNYNGSGFTNYHIGGIAGINHGHTSDDKTRKYGLIEDCCNLGLISSGDEKQIKDNDEDVIAGIAGYNDCGEIIRCYNAGQITASKYCAGGIAGINVTDSEKENGIIVNCHYLKTPEINKYWNAVGYDGNSEETKVYANTAEQFASGEVAYLLGGEWGQKIGVDEYPILGGDKVYFINNFYTNEKPENKYPYEITGLRLTDAMGNEIIAPKRGKSFIVETNIVKNGERNEKDYLFIAVYDTNGALMSLDYVKAKFTVDSECSFGFNIPAQEKEIGSVKAYVWNTFNSIEPLAQAKILAPVVFE